MHFCFLKCHEEHQLSLTKDSDSHMIALQFWAEDCQYFIFPANHINTTIPFIGIFTVSIHTSKVSAMYIQQQKFTFTTRLTDRKRAWNFRSASTGNLVWILTGVLYSHKEVKYRSCLKRSKINHLRERMEMACWMFESVQRYYPPGIRNPWKVIWIIKVCASHVQRSEMF